MIIDVHAHSLDRVFLEELAAENAFGIERIGGGFGFGGYGQLDPLLYDIDRRLEQVASYGIDLQLVSPPPRIVGHVDWVADRAFAQRLNLQTARTVAQSKGRFAGLAVLPLSEPEILVDELHRALDDEGHIGIALPTSVGGRMLDDPVYESLFAECARRRCIVFMHPTTGVMRPALGQYTMLQLVGWPTETALCVGRLIFAGIFERYPDLKLVLAHGGGALAMLIGRLDLARVAPHYEANPKCSAHITRPPSTYLRNIFFDSMVINDKALHFLLDLVGHDRIVFGSDAPFEISDLSGDLVRTALADRSASVLNDIFYGTAQRELLPHLSLPRRGRDA